MPIDFVDQNFATEAFRRGEEAAQARLRNQLDEQRTRLEMDTTRAEAPYRLRSLQADAALSETRADVERQRAPIDLESSRLANVQAGLNVQGSKMDGFLKSLEALENGDVDTAQKIASAMGETIPPEVLNNRTLVGQLKRLGTRAKEMFPNNPAKQQKWLVDATSQLKQGGVESATDPTFPITVQTSVEPESATGGAQSSIGKIEADFKAGRIDQATRDAAIAKATQVGKAGGPALTATDKKAIWAAEDDLPLIENTLETLQRAKALNKDTSEGFGANQVGRYGTYLPDAVEAATAAPTREYLDIMTQEAATQMSQTLKGATTDKELAIYIGIIADVTKPKAQREAALDRMIKFAERKRGIAVDRIKELRGEAPAGYEQADPGADPYGALEEPDVPAQLDEQEILRLYPDARQADDGFYYLTRDGQTFRVEP